MSFLILTLALLLAASDEPEPVAMVLSVSGDTKLRRMDLLRPGDEVRVPVKGSVRLVFLADGHRETLSAGNTVKITSAGGTPADAVTREKPSVPAGQVDGLRTMAASARGGVLRARGAFAPPLPLSPINGATVPGNRPTFEWAPSRNTASHVIQLFRGETDRRENLVWSGSSSKERLDFPEGRQALERGETYTLKVVAGDNETVAQGTFTVATAEQAHEFESLRKLSESLDKSDRLLAAMLYESEQVFGDSHRLFESLAKELPEEPWLILASARHLARLGRVEEAKDRERQALTLARKP
jgi:hypothetical protein